MKYIIANEVDTLIDIDEDDQVVMFPQNAMLAIESLTDTYVSVLAQSSADVDNNVVVKVGHEDASAALTHKAQRNMIDTIVSSINSDSKRGYTVLFDYLNNVFLDGQVAVVHGSNVTEN